MQQTAPEEYPGQQLGLPASGRGSLATWGQRVGALLIDWGASMLVALGAFGQGVITEGGWRSWMILAVFFVQKSLLTALVGSSFGQLISGVGVTRTDGQPLGLGRSILRSAAVCVVVPAVLIGPDRRGLHDLLLGAVVVRRR